MPRPLRRCAFVQVHGHLEESSLVCGASHLTTMRRIIVPLLVPGIVSAWILMASMFIRELTQSLAPESFNSLPIPFRAMGTNLETGELIEFDRGDLAVAMRASMSVPGLFEPVETGGQLVVDGGLAS